MATFVVLLTYRGVYKGMVGPFPEQDDAEVWAAANAEVQAGWSWDIEPLVSADDLAAYVPPRPFLRVVS